MLAMILQQRRPRRAATGPSTRGVTSNDPSDVYSMEDVYQAPENSSKCKVGIELLAHAARPVHLLARHLDDDDDDDGDVADDLPGR